MNFRNLAHPSTAAMALGAGALYMGMNRLDSANNSVQANVGLGMAGVGATAMVAGGMMNPALRSAMFRKGVKEAETAAAPKVAEAAASAAAPTVSNLSSGQKGFNAGRRIREGVSKAFGGAADGVKSAGQRIQEGLSNGVKATYGFGEGLTNRSPMSTSGAAFFNPDSVAFPHQADPRFAAGVHHPAAMDIKALPAMPQGHITTQARRDSELAAASARKDRRVARNSSRYPQYTEGSMNGMVGIDTVNTNHTAPKIVSSIDNMGFGIPRNRTHSPVPFKHTGAQSSIGTLNRINPMETRQAPFVSGSNPLEGPMHYNTPMRVSPRQASLGSDVGWVEGF
jgi:hypothetical protein